MKFMTFNVQHGKNYLTKKIDLPLMADTIAGCRADVIGLNEVYGKGAVFCDQPGALAKYLGEKTGDRWESFFAKAISLSGGPYGNGLVSRYPILHPEVILLKSPPPTHPGYYEDRCILKAGIDLPQGEMTVLICHFGLQPGGKRRLPRTPSRRFWMKKKRRVAPPFSWAISIFRPVRPSSRRFMRE